VRSGAAGERHEEIGMKRVLCILAIMAVATRAFALPVKGGDGPKPPTEAEERAAARKAKEDEKAYNRALERIPDAPKNNDPWSKMR
jgi:hypothetical protein